MLERKLKKRLRDILPLIALSQDFIPRKQYQLGGCERDVERFAGVLFERLVGDCDLT